MLKRTYILAVLLFLAAFKLVDVLLFNTFNWLDAQRPYDYSSLHKLYGGLINADIVFIGSSRIALQINPLEIERQTSSSAYTIAREGTNFDQHLFTIEEYLLHNRRPKIIVAEADEHILDETMPTFATQEFKPFVLYSDHTAALFGDKTSRWRFKVLKSLVYQGRALSIVRDVLAPSISSAENGIDVKGSMLREGNIEKPNWSYSYHFLLSEKRKAQFRQLVALTKEQGITLALLATPRIGQFDEPAFAGARIFFNELVVKNPHVHFIDQSRNDTIRRNGSYWYNTGHTNREGATAFSVIVGKALKALLAQGDKTPA